MGAAEISTALRAKCGFETINVSATDTQARFIGRVSPSQMGGWILVIHQLLSHAEQGAPWSIDISKQYFLKGGRVVFGWRIIIQSPSIEAAVPSLVAVIQGTPRTGGGETTEMPLIGASVNRNTVIRGKGAAPSGKLMTGPDALANLRGGG